MSTTVQLTPWEAMRRGSSRTVPRLLTNRHWEIISLYCFKLVSLWQSFMQQQNMNILWFSTLYLIWLFLASLTLSAIILPPHTPTQPLKHSFVIWLTLEGASDWVEHLEGFWSVGNILFLGQSALWSVALVYKNSFNCKLGFVHFYLCMIDTIQSLLKFTFVE